MEIEKIIYKLFGDIQPLCDTNYDEERFNNIANYEKALRYIVNELIECAKWKDDNRYSAEKIGNKANEILTETLDNICKSKGILILRGDEDWYESNGN